MNTKALKQKILDLAIHGKLVAQNPDDESASVLLEKIRAEKAKLVAEKKMKADKKDSFIFVGDDDRHYEKFADGTVKDIEDEIPFELPEGWCIVHPNQIGTFQGGQTPSVDEIVKTGNIPYFKVSDMNVSGNELYMNIVSNYLKSNCSYRLFPKDSIIYPKNGGAVFTNKKRILTATSLIDLNSGAFIPSKSINNLYAYYLFSSIDFNHHYKGSAVPTVDHDSINELFWGLPPIAEQQRIVSAIQSIFSKIDTLEQNKSDLLTAIKQAKSKILDLAIHGKLVAQDSNDEPAEELLKRIAARNSEDESPFEIPDSWKWCTGNDLFNPMTSKKPSGEKFRYIDIDAIDNKKHCVIQPKSIAVSEAPSRASRELNTGDVLFSLVRPYLENIALIEEQNSDCIASTGFYVCKPKEVLFPKFLFYLMTSEYVVKGLNQFMKGDNSPSINSNDIKNWLYPLPPLSEQKRIAWKIEALFARLEAIQNELAV